MTQRQSEPRRQNRKKGGRIILPALCSIVGTLIILMVIVLLLPTTIARFMGYEVYNVVSESMEPALPMGSMVFVRQTDWHDIEIGDVIAFYSGGAVVTHRVTSNVTYKGEFLTKGDANEEEDISGVPYDQVIGRVEKHVPYLGELTAMMATSLGKLYLLTLLLCGVLFNVLAGRLREA